MSNNINEIMAYNKQLADTLTNVTLSDYTTELHTRFYSNIDISFMKYFMDLIKCDNQFVVEHEKLIEFGVIITTRSNDIKRQMDQYEFEEGKDYLMHNVGRSNKKIYILTPGTFKLALIRSKNTRIYATYYMFIEKLQSYYAYYERDYVKKLASMEKGSLKTELSNVISSNKELKNQVTSLKDNVNSLMSMTNQNDSTNELKNQITSLLTMTTQTNFMIINQSTKINKLLVSTEELKVSNEELKVSNEEIKEQLTLFTVLLSNICSVIMTDVYHSNVNVMKVLVLFVYQKKNDPKYYITFTYCQLSLLHSQIDKKLENSNVCTFVVFKPLKDNVITIQHILETLGATYKVDKRSKTIICNLEQKK